MLLSFFMAEENSQSLQRKRRSTQDRLQFSFNVELPREQETRYFGIKDRIKMARSAMNLSKATSRTQNADLIEAMLLAFEEKMQRRSETLATLTRSSLSSPSVGNQSSSSLSSSSAQPAPMPIATSTPRSRTSLPFNSPVQPPQATSESSESSSSQPLRLQKFQISTEATESDQIYLCSEGALRTLFSFFATDLLAKCCFCSNLLQPDSLSFNRQGHAVSINIFCMCGDSIKWLSSPIMGGSTPKYYVNMR